MVGIHFSPDGDARVLLRSDAWGLFLSTDGGDDFHWVCAESYGGDSLGTFHPSALVARGGRTIVAAQLAGLAVSTADGCSWNRPEELATWVAYDVGQSGGGEIVYALLARDATGTTGAQLFRSDDGGATWDAFGAELPNDFIPSSFVVSDASDILVAGRDPETQVISTTRSTDTAATWSSLVALSVDAAGEVPRLVRDPFDAARSYLRLDAVPLSQDAPDPPDRLLASGDHGASWTLALEADGDLPGLAFSPDGSRMAIAGPREGLLVGPRTEPVDTISSTLDQVFAGPVWGLAWTEAGLFAGLDQFDPEGVEASLGVSQDRGRTFEPVLSICDVTLAKCSSASTSEVACRDVYERLAGFEDTIVLSAPCTVPRATGDAGPPTPRAEKRGCACTTRRPGPPGAPTLLSVAAVATVLRRRTRRVDDRPHRA